MEEGKRTLLQETCDVIKKNKNIHSDNFIAYYINCCDLSKRKN